ncbi:DUF6414 family protein [Clavibacter nebraskensis]|uniref:DUF6414 family protein n=1 Tax=Clavibacter nebraskensis TaxID=31963 RepID=UPI003F4C3F70
MTATNDAKPHPLVKVVYFDEQSASDYLDISAGGSTSVTKDERDARIKKMQASFEGKVAARFSWLPFVGASVSTGAGASSDRDTQSILSKTLSNTILTDFLENIRGDKRVERFPNMRVIAQANSMAYLKMFTPYLMIADTTDTGVDLSRLDDAIIGAKGYYEMVGIHAEGHVVCILRFNVRAFRNSYGLIDLTRMRLVYYVVSVGLSSLSALTFESELSMSSTPSAQTFQDIYDGNNDDIDPPLPVFDVMLAGVERE